MNWVRRIYRIAAIYGLVVLLPQYFLEAQNGRDFPPAITHAEYYYGFIGVVVAWQLGFLVIASNPARYRPMMVPAIVEKASFGIATIVLYVLGRLHLMMFGAGLVDLLLGALFVWAYVITSSPQSAVDQVS